ncbi:MAG: hypothetical protein GY868_17570 [Deltaproteobacteria bacterium]|nr:hypothetical protein [Deltaproteobacteria bacterium]
MMKQQGSFIIAVILLYAGTAFGGLQPSVWTSIQGRCVVDDNGNGFIDEGENAGVAGISLVLKKRGRLLFWKWFEVGAVISAADGSFLFMGQGRGKYIIHVVGHGGYELTTKNALSVRKRLGEGFLLSAASHPGLVFGFSPQDAGRPVGLIASISASPETITAGTSVTICWTCQGADNATVTVSPDIGEVELAADCRDVWPAETTVYTVSAENGTDEAEAEVTVEVTPGSSAPTPDGGGFGFTGGGGPTGGGNDCTGDDCPGDEECTGDDCPGDEECTGDDCPGDEECTGDDCPGDEECIGDDCPGEYDDIITAVLLESLAAEPGCDYVRIVWTTSDETDLFGFNLLRAETLDGTYERINPHVIYGEGGEGIGADYDFEDAVVTAGRRYYYKLEAIDVFGERTLDGPLSAAVSEMCND